MKFIFIFISLTLFNIINSFKEAKDFLTEFIKTTSDDKIHFDIPEQCLGRFFNYHFLLLKKNFKENNFEKLSINVENMAIDIFINCPNMELIKILNETDFEDISSIPTKFKTKIYMKLLNLGTTLYNNYNNNTLTGAFLGKKFGELINLFRANYTNLNELESETSLMKNDSFSDIMNKYFDIIGSIFIGMKEKDDGSESKCYKDIIKGKAKIMKNIEDGFKKADKSKGIGSIITNIIFNLITVEGLVVDCNLLKLGSRIISKVTSLKEMKNLLSKIMETPDIYIEYLGIIFDNFKDNNINEGGKYIGKIISKIFDFHVK